MKHHYRVQVAAVLLCLSPLVSAQGATSLGSGEGALPSRGSTFSLIYENDIFSSSDGHYTNGVRLSWIPGSSETPVWAENIARRIPFFPQEGQVLHGYSFGQNMYTPSDIELEDPPLDERPYAGWLYATIGLAVETGRQLDQVMLTVGMVGPASLAEKTQKLVHKMVGSDEPQGWDTQLRNELGVMVGWQRNWRAWVATNMLGNQFDIAPHVGATVGNIHTYANAGITLRYGDNLPLDYGPPRIQPGVIGTSSYIPRPGLGWYLFAGVEGRAVARNIFLDGNSFRSSRSVDREKLVGDLQVGAVLVWDKVRLSYTHVFRTREYKTQDRSDDFGSLALSYQF
ncbi:MAG TPA: lipid A deacylase LpxR family protein [Porticoccaceae bacterium]